MDLVHPEGGEVVHRRAQPDGLRDGGARHRVRVRVGVRVRVRVTG